MLAPRLRVVTLLALVGIANSSPAQAQTRPAAAAAPAGTAQRAPVKATVQQPVPARTAQRAPAKAAVEQARVPAKTVPAAADAVAPVNNLPVAPFQLTESQQQLLDTILLKWEKQSEKVSTFTCTFDRWEVDPAWGPKNNDFTLSSGSGAIKYKAPDRGEYQVQKVTKWDGAKLAYVPDPDGEQRWMCDGESIYEWDKKARQLKVRPLPPQMKGKAISDGPLPFIFGAKAEQLKQRYWLRDVTRPDQVGKQIWLDARPKYQVDAANFQRVTVILNEKTFMPQALQIFPPGAVVAEGQPQAYTAYGFGSPSVNNPLNIVKGDFLPPITPLGWKRVVIADPAQAPANPPAGAPAQAQRPAAGKERK
jgi:TIGR03009 family protein